MLLRRDSVTVGPAREAASTAEENSREERHGSGAPADYRIAMTRMKPGPRIVGFKSGTTVSLAKFTGKFNSGY